MRKRYKPMRYFPGKNPCDSCIHRPDCDHICWHRARWWDSQMEKLRKKLRGAEHELET